MIASVTGLKQILTNLQRKSAQMERGCAAGLKEAGLLLQRESQKKVPVDTGNLKASAFTRAESAGFKTIVSVGYTAAYAIFVHEAVGMKLKGQLRGAAKGQPGYRGRYWDPQGKAQAKFLEAPMRELMPKLRTIVRNAIVS